MEDVFAAVDARPKRRQGVTGQTIEAQMRGTMCQITEYELDMLRDEITRLKDESAFLKDLMGQRTVTIRKLEAERNQALASVGAVIEKAASVVPKEHMLTGHMIRSIADIQNAIHAINPNATAALNEMLADAWDEGHTVGVVWPEKERNPYRKETP